MKEAEKRKLQRVQPSQFDYVGILTILLESPESWPICDRDGTNPIFDICYDTSVFPNILTQKLISRKL